MGRLQWTLTINPLEQLSTKRSQKRRNGKDLMRLPRDWTNPRCLTLDSLKHDSIVRAALQEALQDRADDHLRLFLEAASDQEGEE